VRILDCNAAGKLSNALAAMDFVRTNVTARGTAAASVINLSIATPMSATLNAAVVSMTSANIAVVVSAGNNKLDACTISPTSEASAIVVGAVDSFDRRAGYSNFGACVDVYAPGTAVQVPDITSPPLGEKQDSGTSYAAPLVTGMVARLRQQFPALAVNDIAASLVCASTDGIVRGNAPSTPNVLLHAAPSGAVETRATDTCAASTCPAACGNGNCRCG
jgi:subtilisin family serine protease